MSHTAGPWKADVEGPFTLGVDTIVVEAVTADGRMVRREICTLLIDTSEDDSSPEAQEDKDNALLIGASPDLLRACKVQCEAIDWLLAKVCTLDRKFLPSESPAFAALVEGREAVARAEPKMEREPR